MLFAYTIFLMLIIGGGIAIGVVAFFGKGYDFREAEAGVLGYRIKKCIVEERINWDVGGDFYDKCRIDSGVVSEGKYVIGVSERDSGKSVFKWGDVKGCGLAKIGKNYPVCREFFVDGEGKKFKVIIGSNNLAVRVVN